MITYYTYSVESKTLAKAPRVIVRDGKTIILGQPEDFAQYLNAYPAAAYEPPTPIEGKTAVPNGYELRNGEWHQIWNYIDNPPPTIADFDAATEEHLTEERMEHGYTTREPDVYLNSQVPRWASDARDWVAHRDAVMLYALEIMNAVEAGTREPPTLDEFKAGLPQIAWSFVEQGERTHTNSLKGGGM